MREGGEGEVECEVMESEAGEGVGMKASRVSVHHSATRREGNATQFTRDQG